MQHMHWWQATQVTPFRHPPAGRLPLVKSDVRRLTCALVVLIILATGKSCVPLARPLLILHEHQHAQVTTSKQSLPLQGVCSPLSPASKVVHSRDASLTGEAGQAGRRVDGATSPR